MTRREEIINNIGYKMTKAALEYVEKHEFADVIDAFEAGAEWANKTMIDKVCNFIIAFNERAKLGIIEPLINVEIFRRAMEE